MLTKRLVAVVSGGLLTAAVITGCGESSDDGGDGGSGGGDDYCDTVKDVQGEFDSLESADATLDDMGEMSDRMGDIADAAPSDISKEWDSLHTAIDDMVTALEDADVETDVPLQDAVQKAAEEDPSKLKDIQSKLTGFQNAQTDVKAVQDQVKKECDIELGDNTEESQ